MRSDSIFKYQTNKCVPKSSYKIYAWLTINTHDKTRSQYTNTHIARTQRIQCALSVVFRLCNIKYPKWNDDTKCLRKSIEMKEKKSILKHTHTYISIN